MTGTAEEGITAKLLRHRFGPLCERAEHGLGLRREEDVRNDAHPYPCEPGIACGARFAHHGHPKESAAVSHRDETVAVAESLQEVHSIAHRACTEIGSH